MNIQRNFVITIYTSVSATHTSPNPAEDPLKNVEGSGTMMGGISGILWAGSRSEDGEEHTPHHSTGEGGRARWQKSMENKPQYEYIDPLPVSSLLRENIWYWSQ